MDPHLARTSAVVALLAVVVEAAAACVVSLVPALSATFSGAAGWVGAGAPALAAAVALVVLSVVSHASPPPTARAPGRGAVGGALVLALVVVVALALGATAAGTASLSPSLAGLGLAFAAPLVTGEALAAGAWIAGGGERAATALSLAGAALTTCAAAFLVERTELDVATLAVAAGGLGAQAQLAIARIGEGLFVDAGGPSFARVVRAAAARFAAVPRALVLASVGRSDAQEGA